MISSLRSGVLLALLSVSVLTTTISCSKKTDDPVAVATTGKLEGTISPAGAVSTVTATNSGGLTFLATPNATSGVFSLSDLVPGAYSLSFTPTSGYAAPTTRTANVTAGQTTAAGTVVVTGNGTPRGTVTWTKDGTAYTSTVLSGLISNQTFSMEASATNPAFTDYISLDVPSGITAVGTYSLNGSSSPYSNFATYRRTTGATTVVYTTLLRQTSSTTGISGTGTLVVNNYDEASRTMSGTFAFDAYNADNGVNNVVRVNIINGSFNLRF